MYTGGNPVTYSDPSGHCIGIEGLFCAESAVATGQQFLGGVIDTGSRYAADAANWTTSTIASTWSGLTQTYQNFAAGFESGVNDLRKEVQSFAVGVDRWAAGVQAQVRSTIASYHIDVSALEAFGQVVLSDPHMMLGMLSVVPGLGEIAAAADMALYLYQGDYANAALAATMFVPGGAVLALGAGAKGFRELSTFARAGAKDLGAAVEGSRVLRGLDRAGESIHEVVSAAKAKVSGWVLDQARTVQLQRVTTKTAVEIKDLVRAGDSAALERMSNAPGWVKNAIDGSARDLGNLIDRVVKDRAPSYRFLDSLDVTPAFTTGADFVNPATKRAWDVTTQLSWRLGGHQELYDGMYRSLTGIQYNYRWGPGSLMQHLFKW